MEVSMRSTFFHSLKRNQDMLAESLNLDQNDDIVTRSFTALGRSCALYFVEGMASGQRMSDSVLRPLLRAQEELSGRQALEAVTRRLIEAPEVKTEKQPYAAVQQLMRGQTLVLIDTVDEAVLVDLRGYIRRPVSIPQTENVVIGPHEAFTEPLRDNLTLLHRMLPTPRLICKLGQVGTRISTQTAVCYLEGICPQETVDEVQRRLEASAIDHVLTVGELSQLIEDDPFAPLPQVVSTERPDRAASFLAEGQVVVLTDGSPLALGAPSTFWHQLHTSDDASMRWQYGTFLRVVRLIGMLIHLFLPGAYIAVIRFHTELISPILLASVYETSSRVPTPIFLDALLMTLAFDLISEAGLRAPGTMGNALGIVSGLILGQSAVSADIVSPLLLIVVAASGLGGFCIPNYALSVGIKIIQLLFLTAGALGGLYLMALLGLALLCAACAMRSVGSPLTAPFTPKRPGNPDLLIRFPLWRQKARAFFARQEH